MERYDRESHTTGVTQITKPDIVAPGEITAPRASGFTVGELNPELSDPDYVQIAGTSQATAVVSGLAALIVQLLRSRNADLGIAPARALRRLFCLAAKKLEEQPVQEFGHGLVIWPTLVATIEDFLTDPLFRAVVLDDSSLLLTTQARRSARRDVEELVSPSAPAIVESTS